jgi:hypothetical protein
VESIALLKALGGAAFAICHIYPDSLQSTVRRRDLSTLDRSTNMKSFDRHTAKPSSNDAIHNAAAVLRFA